MDAVLLAVTSAFLFGGDDRCRSGSRSAGGAGAEAGALFTVLVALGVTLPFTVVEGIDVGEVWPFLLAGLLGPGLSQLLFTLAVREAGPSRTSVVVGTAPLFSVAIALVFLDEALQAGLVVGAILIVAGGLLLVGERGRPEHVRVARPRARTGSDGGLRRAATTSCGGLRSTPMSRRVPARDHDSRRQAGR